VTFSYRIFIIFPSLFSREILSFYGMIPTALSVSYLLFVKLDLRVCFCLALLGNSRKGGVDGSTRDERRK
jgi:hypothetical protein